MKKTERSKLAVQDFAGIDVSAHELDVAMRRGIDDSLTIATFPNRAAGHKALLRFLRPSVSLPTMFVPRGGWHQESIATIQRTKCPDW